VSPRHRPACARLAPLLATIPLGFAAFVASACSSDAPADPVARTSHVAEALWSWTSYAPTPHGRGVLLPLGSTAALAIGGANGSASCDRFDFGTRTWASDGSMITARAYHAGVALPGGDLLVVGGSPSTGGALSSAERYVATTKTWTALASAPTARISARAGVLAGGDVVVVGGQTGSGAALASVDRWSVGTGAWSAGPAMASARGNLTLTTLADGRQLAIGGTSTAEVLSANGAAWSSAGTLLAARVDHAAVRLASGDVLVTGGLLGTKALSTVERWSATTGTFTQVAAMNGRRARHAAVVLANGNVLVAGGWDGVRLSTAELYDPGADAWTTIDAIPATKDGAMPLDGPLGVVQGTAALIGFGIGGPAGAFVQDAFVFQQSANGATCARGIDCRSGYCVDGVCCDAACGATCSACDVAGKVGTCSAITGAPHGARAGCGVYACVAGACATSCLGDGDCASGSFCDAGACAPKRALGASCSATSQCAGGVPCVDGVCCESACAAQCWACDVSGKLGTCAPVTGAPHGARASCAPYACAAGSCGGGCTTDAECAGGFRCSGGTCVAKHALGETCTSDAACTSGHCADGVCCDVACAGACEACDTGGKLGTCAAIAGAPHAGHPGCGAYLCVAGSCGGSCASDASCAAGTWCDGAHCSTRGALGAACPRDEACASGHCVDGVCCDRACDAQCEACDVGGKLGVCTPVAGAPHGARTPCEAGTGTCDARTCDGAKETTRCVGFAKGTSDVCAPSACDGWLYTPQSTCSGAGRCQVQDPVSCAPYRCDPSGCKTACDADTACADDYVCRAGACVAREKVSTCSADRSESIAGDGVRSPCGAYACDAADGKCRASCLTSDDCAAGAACSEGACLPTTAPSATDDGGCQAARAGGNGRGLGVSALLTATLAWARRRRRKGLEARARKVGVAAVVAIGAAGCGGRSGAQATEDAGGIDAAPVAAPIAGRGDALTIVRGHAAFRLFGRGSSARFGPVARLRVELPAQADVGVRLELPDGASWTVRELDLWPRAASAGGADGAGARVFREVAPATDLLASAEDGRYETLRVLHDAAAPDVRLAVHLDRLAGLRARGDRLEAIDEGGRVRATTAPIFAIDAAGVRRAISPVVRCDAAECTVTLPLDRRGLVYPIVVDPVWSAADSLSAPRLGQVVSFPSGKVLAAGGYRWAIFPPNGAEIWDPTLAIWKPTAPIASSLDGYATLLDATHALVIAWPFVGTYDATADAWTSTASPSWRMEASLCRLASGDVLIAGGDDGSSSILSAETWNGSTWSAAGSLPSGRSLAAIACLPSGKAILFGGLPDPTSGTRTVTTALWDPATRVFTPGPDMAVARSGAIALPLPSGKILVTGGTTETVSEIYDPASNSFAMAASTKHAHDGIAVGARLSTGRILVAGGYATSVAELYDPTRDLWRDAGTTPTPRFAGDLASLGGDRFLWVGGLTPGGPIQETWLLKLSPNGAACGDGGECASYECVDGVCCDRACGAQCEACDVGGHVGTCTAVASGPVHGARASCAPYFCRSGACATSCASQSDCVAGDYCDGAGACKPKKAVAAACAANVECQNGTCVDGFCCGAPCTDSCSACDVPGHLGACFPYSGPVRGVRSGCGAYACKAGACATTCGAASDCAAGYGCVGGLCTAPHDLGDACTADAACASGHCVDGVCCDAACAGSCQACDVTGKRGLCSPVTGAPHGARAGCAPYFCAAGACATSCAADDDCEAGDFCDATSACAPKRAIAAACARDAECGGGHCVDGVCCDRACDGQCEACDVTGHVGACFPVAGAPHGGRLACDDGGGQPCAARRCDGVADPSRCVAFVNGPELECEPSHCKGTSFVQAGHCDGAGACAIPTASSCLPFTCEASGCLHGCTESAQCGPGFRCVSGGCLAIGDVCSLDLSRVERKDGSVVPCGAYVCRAGACLDSCTSSDDCAPGKSCDTASKGCIATTPDAPAAAQGGCEAAGGRGVGTLSAAVLAIAASAFGARRRRARA
jgi:hypothetical protein